MSRRTMGLRRVWACAAVGVLVMTVVGCSGGGGDDRNYAVPKRVCGVPMGEDTVAPLLPDGDRLTESGPALPVDRDFCELKVDRAPALTVSFDPTEQPRDPLGDTSGDEASQVKAIPELPFPGKGAVADERAVAVAGCGGRGLAPHLSVDVTLNQTVTEDVAERRDALREFLVRYVEGARKQLGCGEQRDYPPPKTVCGVSMDPDVVAPLIPSGLRAAVKGEGPPQEYGTCEVGTYRGDVLEMVVKPAGESTYSREIHSYRFTHRKRIDDLPFPGKGALGDDSALISMACSADTGSAGRYLNVYFSVDEGVADDASRRRDDLRKFAVAYMEGARKDLGCT